MKVTGALKVQKRIKQVAPNVRAEVSKATERSGKRFANFARRIAPRGETGETRRVINFQGIENENGVFGFVNFAENNKRSAIRQASISYGREKGNRGMTYGYEYIHMTKMFIGDKFKRAIKRAVKQAISNPKNLAITKLNG